MNVKKRKLFLLRNEINLVVSIMLLVLNSLFAFWYYWWTTYTEFEVDLQPLVILEGWDVLPGEFINDSQLVSNVSADWHDPELLSFETGKQDVSLILSQGWRTLEATSTLYVLKPYKSISVEFKSSNHKPEPIELLINADDADIPLDLDFIVQPLPFDEYSVGEHSLYLTLNDTPFTATLIVEDTTPPEATPVNIIIPIGESVYPEMFVTDVYDASPILSIVFTEEPDIYTGGNHPVRIEISDIYNNTGFFESILTIEPNKAPPIFEGLGTIAIMKGNTVLYRHGVTAFDDFGREIQFFVDSSQVNQNVVGNYEVLYWAQDLTGLQTHVSIPVHVLDIDPDYVNERVDTILASILDDSITQVEQLKAIFLWIGDYMSYSSYRGGKSSIYEGAHHALQNRRGDCFVFYSIAELMLTRAEIPNMRIVRIPTTPTPHLWNLVNPDGLGWYHFDSWLALRGSRRENFMFTQSKAEELSRQFSSFMGHRDFYTYVPSLYPDIVP